jgi:amidase
MANPKWKQLAADKKASIDNSIPAEWKLKTRPEEDNVFDYPDGAGILSDAEITLTKTSATDLVAKLAKGEVKSVDVTLAFAKRAAIAHQLVSPPSRPGQIT